MSSINIESISAINDRFMGVLTDGRVLAPRIETEELARVYRRKYEQKISFVKGLEGIVQISMGSDYSLALNVEGQVFIWGDRYYNRTAPPDCKIPQIIPDLKGIIAIGAANRAGAFLNGKGELFFRDMGGWKNRVFKNWHETYKLEKKEHLKGIKSFDCYLDGLVVLTDEGKAFYQQTASPPKKLAEMIQIPGKKLTKVIIGKDILLGLTKSGDVLKCVNTSFIERLDGSYESNGFEKKPILKNIQDIAFGQDMSFGSRQFYLALGLDDKVYKWEYFAKSKPVPIYCDEEVKQIIFSNNSCRVVDPQVLEVFYKKMVSEGISL